MGFSKMVRSLTGFLMEVGIGRWSLRTRRGFWKAKANGTGTHSATAGSLPFGMCCIKRNGRTTRGSNPGPTG